MSLPYKIAVVGYGGFGRFVVESLKSSTAVQVAVIVDPQIKDSPDMETMLADPTIDAVHIATPPDTHAKLALMVLRAGKHVVVEKPLALTPADAQQVVDEAAKKKLVAAVSYILRYNPILRALKDIIHDQRFGQLRFIQLENVAADVQPATHWFWDVKRSGGILLEHGVHFFDATAYLLNEVPVFNSGTLIWRAGRNMEALATTSFASGTIASFTHGFFTTKDLERTNWLFVWDRARASVAGWIPLRLEIETGTGETQITQLPEPKQTAYANCLRDLWQDVARAIETGGQPLANGEAGLESVQLAWQASQAAIRF